MARFLHHFHRRGIVANFVPLNAAARVAGHRRCGGIDQCGACALQRGYNHFQVRLISLMEATCFPLSGVTYRPWRVEILQIVESEIEVNDIPVLVSDPLMNTYDAQSRWPAVDVGMLNIGLACEQLPHFPRVAH